MFTQIEPYQVLPHWARVDQGCNGNEGVLCTLQSSSIIGTSSGCLVSYTKTLIGRGLTPLQRCSWCIQQPQLTGQSLKYADCIFIFFVSLFLEVVFFFFLAHGPVIYKWRPHHQMQFYVMPQIFITSCDSEQESNGDSTERGQDFFGV